MSDNVVQRFVTDIHTYIKQLSLSLFIAFLLMFAFYEKGSVGSPDPPTGP